MIESALCWILCARVAITTPKIEVKHELPNISNQSQQVPVTNEKRPNTKINTTTRVTQKNTRSTSGDTNSSETRSKVRPNNPDAANTGNGDVVSVISKYAGAATPAAIELWRRESGLRPGAINKSSGACGLVQALPCSKLPCSLSDTECQVKWGTEYVSRRYGGFEQALAFHDKNNWY